MVELNFAIFRMKIRIKKSVFWKNYVVKYIYEKSVNRNLIKE